MQLEQAVSIKTWGETPAHTGKELASRVQLSVNLDADSELPVFQTRINIFHFALPSAFQRHGLLGLGFVFELFPQRNHIAGLESNCDKAVPEVFSAWTRTWKSRISCRACKCPRHKLSTSVKTQQTHRLQVPSLSRSGGLEFSNIQRSDPPPMPRCYTIGPPSSI